jgi:hypothetical protein
MLIRLTNLETGQNDLASKVLGMLDKTNENNQALVEIKVMFSGFLEKMKDRASPIS